MGARWTSERHGTGVAFNRVRQLVFGILAISCVPCLSFSKAARQERLANQGKRPRFSDPMIVISTYFSFNSNNLTFILNIGKMRGIRSLRHAMNILERIKRSVANQAEGVFLRAEFERFGSPAQVGRALRQLTQGGVLVRLGLGVYAKAKPSVLSGQPIPARPLEVLAPEVLKKLGIAVMPSRLTQDYNAGRSTQLPSGIVLNTGKRRIARRLSFNGQAVQYERA